MNDRVFFVDDDAKAGELFQRFSADSAFQVEIFQQSEAALRAFSEQPASVVVTDLSMPGMDGLTLMKELLSIQPDVAVIMITGYATVDNAIEAMKLGAIDFVRKPYDMDELLVLIARCLDTVKTKRENRRLKRQLKQTQRFQEMVGESAALKSVQATIDKIADVRCNVIIQGESGTGKELAARAIHGHSQDADRPFVVIDCGAMTESLLESELFGHEKGAFTGAVHSKRGLLEEASGGTVFLDEIGNISDAMQVRLLRVVQENQLLRVGGVRPVEVDLRFLAASNRDLEQMVNEGAFREDLYHRLNVIKITMPPLRERPEDIPVLAQTFLNEFAQRYGRDVQGFDSVSMQYLLDHPWPGNIRELKNQIERAVALAEDGRLHLDQADQGATSGILNKPSEEDWPSLKELETRYIQKVLSHTEGNREAAAKMLGINKSTLWRKLK